MRLDLHCSTRWRLVTFRKQCKRLSRSVRHRWEACPEWFCTLQLPKLWSSHWFVCTNRFVPCTVTTVVLVLEKNKVLSFIHFHTAVTTYHFTCDSAQALSAESGSKTLRPFGGHSGAHGFTVSPCFTFENQGRVLPAGTAGRLYTRSDLALSQATYTDGGLHTKTDWNEKCKTTFTNCNIVTNIDMKIDMFGSSWFITFDLLVKDLWRTCEGTHWSVLTQVPPSETVEWHQLHAQTCLRQQWVTTATLHDTADFLERNGKHGETK